MSEMTLAEMAREIERRRKGTLPQSISVEFDSNNKPCLVIDRFDEEGITDGDMVISDDLAHSILREAMVMALRAKRCTNGWEYVAWIEAAQTFHTVLVLDSDHGNCPTRSLFAAFVAVFPAPEEPT